MNNRLKMINQLKYPKEFRILPLKMPLEALKQLEELIKNHTKTAPLSNVPLIEKEANKEFLAEVSVGAWRLKKKMIDVETGQPFDEMNRTYRHLESILLTLEKEGIEIQDHDGQQFDAGLSLKVLAYQPTPNIDQEYVLETIKPSIYLKGDRILMGEVIVSTFIKEDQRN